MSSYTWYPSGFAIIDENNQGVNNHTSSVLYSNARSGGSKQLLAEFALPSELHGVEVTSHHFYIKATSLDCAGFSGGFLWVNRLYRGFYPEGATWANNADNASWQCVLYGTGWQEFWIDDSIGAKLETFVGVAKYGIRIDPDSVSFYTPAANGLKIELTCEAATHSVSIADRTVDPSAPLCLYWNIVSNATLASLAQISAMLTYKLNGSDTEYTEIVSGANSSVTIPANTFPVGANSYKVSVTLEDGQVISSSWARITVNAASVSNASPASGYVANEANVLFSWALKRQQQVAGSFFSVTPTGGSLQWRDGEDGTVTTIDIGTAQSYSMPANTLPNSASIQWRLYQITTAAVDSVTSDWMTVTTLESGCSAAIVAPTAVSVDGGKPITFQWSHIISTGTPPTGFEIQTSSDGSTYTQLVEDLDSDEQQYTADANTFTSGKLYWKVRTYNTDGTAGSWSTAASIVVIATPTTPAIAILDTSPRPRIRWTTSEQEGFELTLDGQKYTVYGSEQAWQSPDYLSDGQHSVSVRVINQYGIWSEPGTAVIPVSNTAGADIYLAAEAGKTAELNWESGGYDFYIVYRDGTAIAKVSGLSYEDLFSCGEAVYRVRGCYEATSNYGLSGELPVSVRPEHLTIIDAATGTALELKYFDGQRGSAAWSRAQQATLMHLAGQAKPSAELSEWVDMTLSVSNVAVIGLAAKKALEELLGRLVCLKTPDGDMATGPLTALSKVSNRFYSVYTVAVTDTAHEEAVAL